MLAAPLGSLALSCQSTTILGSADPSAPTDSSSAIVAPSRTAAPYVDRAPVIGRFAATATFAAPLGASGRCQTHTPAAMSDAITINTPMENLFFMSMSVLLRSELNLPRHEK